ncbi:hypothetical protein EG68_05800 [Paragonimus skrjabini miyazakii]|uniref:Uncharacterized protein n=1 Tax=Paragonimus skrjabini miyazakii TaxID=59628 RepID=A0A8S9YYX3_9TREM|nr:hypothetical protein EG68_05800 [Paragonimus skrjabini miyazakii]
METNINCSSDGQHTEGQVKFPSLDKLIKQIETLTQIIFNSGTAQSLALIDHQVHSRELFVHEKSIKMRQIKLRLVLQAMQTVTRNLLRYQRLMEKLLLDIRSDIKLSTRGKHIREMQTRSKATELSDIMDAEKCLLNGLKSSFEAQFRRLHKMMRVRFHCSLTRLLSHIKDLIAAQHQVDILLNEQTTIVNELRGMQRRTASTSMSRTEQGLQIEVNSNYPEIWNPTGMLRSVEELFEQATRLRRELDAMLPQIPQFVQGTRAAIHEALINSLARNTEKQRCVALTMIGQRNVRNHWLRTTSAMQAKGIRATDHSFKSLQHKMDILDETKNRLDAQYDRFGRCIEADLKVLRLRRREFNQRLIPDLKLIECTVTKPVRFAVRRMHTVCT